MENGVHGVIDYIGRFLNNRVCFLKSFVIVTSASML